MDQKLDLIIKMLGTIEQRLVQVEQKVDNLEQRVTRLEQGQAEAKIILLAMKEGQEKSYAELVGYRENTSNKFHYLAKQYQTIGSDLTED